MVEYERYWCMASKNTYDMKPVRELLQKEVKNFSIDPFANKSEICTINNDINGDTDQTLNHDAMDFLDCFDTESVDLVLFDAPYSPRQVSECYKAVGIKVDNLKTNASFWSTLKDEVARITKKGAKVISFGWNTVGMGKKRGFKLLKVIDICHGGQHNDTLITIEEKIADNETNGMFKSCVLMPFENCPVKIVQKTVAKPSYPMYG